MLILGLGLALLVLALNALALEQGWKTREFEISAPECRDDGKRERSDMESQNSTKQDVPLGDLEVKQALHV